MLTLSAGVAPRETWLLYQLRWTDVTTAPTLIVRFFDGSNLRTLGKRQMRGSRAAWFRLLRTRYELTEALWAVIQNLAAADSASSALLHEGLDLAASVGLDIGSRPALFVTSNRPFSVEGLVAYVHYVLARQQLSGKANVIAMGGHRTATVAAAPTIPRPLVVACPDVLLNSFLRPGDYFLDPDVQAHVMHLVSYSHGECPRTGYHIGIADVSADPASGRRLADWLGRSMDPHVAIFVNAEKHQEYIRPSALRAAAMAAVLQPPAHYSTADAVRTFLDEIVHDRPIHAALDFAAQRDRDVLPIAPTRVQVQSMLQSSRLFGDPSGDQSFRLSSAMAEVEDASAKVFSVGQDFEADKMLGALRSLPNGTDAAAEFDSILSGTRALSLDFRDALRPGIDFSGERRGMVPLAKVIAATRRLQAVSDEVARQFAQLLRIKGVGEALEANQERKVDAALYHRPPLSQPYPVHAKSALSPGAALQLKVTIGQRSPDSLVQDDTVSALDPLLPHLAGDERHSLDIVVFPKDFVLTSAPCQTVELSRFGGTPPVSFDLLAPGFASDAGNSSVVNDGLMAAELRFSVYFHNQLLQSFKLLAQVGVDGRAAVEPIAIVCDFSQTKRFGRLSELGMRDISLAFNLDGSGSTHTLMVKDGSKAESIRLPETQMALHVKRVREVLVEAVVRNGQGRFLFDPVSLGLVNPDPQLFDDTIRRLARAGSNLYGQLLLKSGAVADMLSGIANSADMKTIQVVLADTSFAVPWAALYDYRIPKAADDSQLAVCRGTKANGDACNCFREPVGFCMRGLWGYRNVIEQLADTPTIVDGAIGKIADTPTAPTVGLLRTVADSWANGLSALLSANKGVTVMDYPPLNGMMPMLGVDNARPALLVYVGHQINKGSDEAPEPRLVRPPDDFPVLELNDLAFEIREKKNWKAPRSLVLLLACDSGTTRVDTGVGFAGAMLKLGAIGVVGTECSVYTSLVAKYANELVSRLASNMTIGRAIHETNWALAEQGCPLSLAFTYLGTIEARLPCK